MNLRTSTLLFGLAGALTLTACSARPTSGAVTTDTPTPDAQATLTAPAPQTPRRTPVVQKRAPVVPVSRKVADEAKGLLNQGSDVNKAATGFGTPEQFLAVAHAAHNLNVPFVVLKDHVLRQHQALARAIRDVKPAVNATAQAQRATSEARADLSGHA